MKRSDTETDTVSGKFLARAKPLGTVTEEMVLRRAKEIAVTKGRIGNNFTQDDMDEARRELTGYPLTSTEDVEQQAPSAGSWLSDAPGTARKTPVRAASDEQTVAEKLVQEGVEEANHHQMMAGNQKKRDEDLS
jgi:hypothetical protein